MAADRSLPLRAVEHRLGEEDPEGVRAGYPRAYERTTLEALRRVDPRQPQDRRSHVDQGDELRPLHSRSPAGGLLHQQRDVEELLVLGVAMAPAALVAVL